VLGGEGFDSIVETMLMFAARREHVVTTIRPALDAGMWVICDRFADSTRAYQCFGQGVPGDIYAPLAEMALEGLQPDLTIILDVATKAGEARRHARGLAADRYERLDAAFHARVRAGFLTIAAAEPGRCEVIDAAPGRDLVFDAVYAAVKARLSLPA
jgi:dTMP kinase